MINYRHVFNPSYNYIGIILTILITIAIIIIEKDILASIYKISESFLIAGSIILVMTLLLNLTMEFLIISNYKVFIEIITTTVIRNLYLYSIMIIVISLFTTYITKKIQNKNRSQRVN